MVNLYILHDKHLQNIFDHQYIAYQNKHLLVLDKNNYIDTFLVQPFCLFHIPDLTVVILLSIKSFIYLYLIGIVVYAVFLAVEVLPYNHVQ